MCGSQGRESDDRAPAPWSPVGGRADRWWAVGRAGPGPVAAPGCHGRTAQHRLDLERRHEPASRRLRRCAGPDAGARSPGAQSIRYTHAFTHGAGLRAEPRRDHHGHVSERDRRAAHAHDRGYGAGAAGPVSRGAAVLCEGVPGVPARGRLLHEQPRQDRLPVRRAVHDLGRRGAGGALEQPPGQAQPFFSVFNLEVTHESQIFPSSPARKGKPLVTDPAQIEVPPYYPDTPVVREELARMYDNIADMDGQVGEILQQLEEDGLADNTIVFYWSDHGDGVPRAKRSLYDSGLRVPLMIRWPKTLGRASAPGPVSDDLVSLIDLAPTVLALAGVEMPAHMQGRVLVGPQAGAGARVRVRRARSDGHRIRHDAIGPRRAVPLHPQLLARAAVRRPHHLSQPERDHAGVAAGCRRSGADRRRPRSGCGPAVRRRSSTTRAAIRTRSRTSPPIRRTAPRSSGCAPPSPNG